MDIVYKPISQLIDCEYNPKKLTAAKYEQILIPCVERSLTLEDERELIIRLKKNTADWDEDILKEAYDMDELESMGFSEDELAFMVDDDEDQEFQDPEVEFTEQMLLDHNYVVLYFDNPMDWQVAIEKFGLKKVKELIDVKEPTKGIGRVIEGKTILNKIQ